MATKSNKNDHLEKQVDAAIEAGLIPSLAPQQPVAKKRGRPSTKSKERQQQPQLQQQDESVEMLMPEEKRIENEKKVHAVITAAKKTRLIAQLRAFSVYFPEITHDAVQTLVLEELDVKQLESLLKCFRENALGASEITSIPLAIKKILGKTETTLVGIGMANSDHPVLGELVKMSGLAEKIEKDKEIDTNVKLISVELVGRLPRNPYLNILQGVVRCAWDLYNETSFKKPLPEVSVDPRYSKLNNNKAK